MRVHTAGSIIAACALLPGHAIAQETLYRIGTVSGQIESASQDSFTPFTDYLSQRIPGTRFEMVPLPTIEALLNAADEQRLEFAFSTPVAFVELNARHRLRPIATVTQFVGEQAYPWLASAVFARQSRRDIQQLTDVRGKQVIALSPLALGGWLAAVREWRALGIDEQRDLGGVRFVFSYARVAADVCAGTADVGVLSAATLRDVSGECAEGFRVLPGPAGARDPKYPADVSSRLYPEAAFAVVGDNVDERLVTKVALELLSIEPGSAVARAATVAGFTAPLSYTPVQQLMEELRIGPYESYGRLTFTQAIEQHAGKVLLVLLAFLSILTFAFVRTRLLNSELARSIANFKTGEEERARLEAQLHHSQRMDSIGRLAGAVAHDFNNLLTVINGYSEMWLAGGDGDSVRHNFEQINKAGRRAAELTHQLLTFSKKQISRPVALDLNTVVRDSETMFSRLLGEEIRLVTTLHPSPWLAMADPGQMQQVLMNLVVNGRDAMPTGGTLTITTDNANVADRMDGISPGAYVTLTVTDTGVGMDEATRQHIFEPFFSTKGAAGTGLGLSTVYGIVRQSQGGVLVSTRPGAGTTFSIFLPRTDQTGEPIAASAGGTAARPVGAATILVVEDQDDVRGFARSVLEKSSYRVLEAASGEMALTVGDAEKTPIHLLLTDVVLRGMNGRELSERFRLLHPETRVLFTSGYTDDEIARRGVQQGSIAFLAKPYSADGLRERVVEVLRSG